MATEEQKKLWRDPTSWAWGVIYNCPEDSRVWVPKRIRWTGWTLNFAHRSAYAWLFALLAISAAAITLSMFVTGR